MKGKPPHPRPLRTIDDVLELIESVDQLTAEQEASCREFLHLDDPRSISLRTSETVSNFEMDKFFHELQFREKGSPYILIKARRIYRYGNKTQRTQLLKAMEPLLKNSYVRKQVTGEES